jgi:hypothetical protein
MVLNSEMTVEEAVALMTNFEPPIYSSLFEAVAAFTDKTGTFRPTITSTEEILKKLSIEEIQQNALFNREMYMRALYLHIECLLAIDSTDLISGARNSGVQKVTLESLVEWARDEYGVGWTKFNESEEDLGPVSSQDEIVTNKKLYVILGYFIEYIAQVDRRVIKESSGNINHSEIFNKVDEMMIKDFCNNIPRGYGDSTVRKVIKQALKSKQEFILNNNRG